MISAMFYLLFGFVLEFDREEILFAKAAREGVYIDNSRSAGGLFAARDFTLGFHQVVIQTVSFCPQ
jgi:hypothetical protein